MRHALSRIRVRIIVLALVPSMIVLGAVAGYSILTFRQTAAEMVLSRNLIVTELLAQQLSSRVTQLADPLVALSRQRDITSSESAHQATALRWSIGDIRSFDAGVAIIDAEGIVTAADPRRPELVGQDWSDRLFVKRLDLPLGNAVASDIEDLGPKGRPVICLCVRLRTHNAPYTGAIVGMFSLDTDQASDFYRSLAPLGLQPSTRTYLVDSSGHIIDPRRDIITNTDVSSLQAVQRVMAGQSGALETADLWQNRTITSFAPIPDTLWGLVEEQSWDEITAESARRIRFLLLLLVLGLGTPPVILALAIQRIIAPMRRLTQAATGMAAGNLIQHIDCPPGDEIAEMADAFNSMSTQLAELYDNLEDRVHRRTHELETLYDIATAVGQTLELEVLLDIALEKATSALHADFGLIHYGDLHDPQYVTTSGHTEPEIAGLIPKAMVQRLMTGLDDDAMLSVPLVAQGKTVGGIVLVSGEPSRFDDHDRQLLAAIGHATGVAAENAMLFSMAQESAANRERNRIARELHDSVTQTLFSANLIAGVLPLLLETDPEQCPAKAHDLHQLTRGALAEMRMLLLELRPESLIRTDLDELLQQLVTATSVHAQLPIDLNIGHMPALEDDKRLVLYRVAQESLNNIVKHARASHAQVSLQLDTDAVCLTISDNGHGMPSGDNGGQHLGIAMMRERLATVDGSLAIHPLAPRGTAIIARCPLNEIGSVP